MSSIDISHNDYSNLNRITMLFTPNENVNSFIQNDITINNGRISNFEASGNNYIASVRPIDNQQATISVYIDEDKFKDSYNYSNTSKTNTFIWNYDGIKPTISITSDSMTSGETNNFSEININFTLSKPLPTLSISNIDVVRSLSALQNVDLTYSNTSSSYLNTENHIELYVDVDKVQDIYGNKNIKSNVFRWASDTLKPAITNMVAKSRVSKGK